LRIGFERHSAGNSSKRKYSEDLLGNYEAGSPPFYHWEGCWFDLYRSCLEGYTSIRGIIRELLREEYLEFAFLITRLVSGLTCMHLLSLF
jgi:hypothetical protein